MPREGYIAEIRELIGDFRLLVVATAALIVGDDGRVLLQHRSDTRDWSPPGGLMDPGETVVGCLRREIREETGLTLGEVDLFGVYSGRDYFGTYPNGDQIASVLVVFVCRDWTGTVTADAESLELRWCDPALPPGRISPHHVTYLADFVAGTPQVQ